jgi:hypothetical protein
MALTERQQHRLRGALEAAIRVDDAVAGVADELAHAGDSRLDAELDKAARLLRELVPLLEALVAGERRRT